MDQDQDGPHGPPEDDESKSPLEDQDQAEDDESKSPLKFDVAFTMSRLILDVAEKSIESSEDRRDALWHCTVSNYVPTSSNAVAGTFRMDLSRMFIDRVFGTSWLSELRSDPPQRVPSRRFNFWLAKLEFKVSRPSYLQALCHESQIMVAIPLDLILMCAAPNDVKAEHYLRYLTELDVSKT